MSKTIQWIVVCLCAAGMAVKAQQLNYTPYLFKTIAGTASIGSADGVGSAARFNGPESVVADAAGNIYVADTDSHTIRSLTRSGTNWVVATIAGVAGQAGFADGAGASARFNDPDGIAIDKTGTLYVSDLQNFMIRKLTFNGSAWVASTVAGTPGGYGNRDGTNGEAAFDNPAGLCLDSAGTIYVADYANSEIRKISPSGTNWVTTTIAGTGNSGYADGFGTNAAFFYPHDVALDKAGNLYVADGLNYLIRKMTPNGPNWETTTIGGQVGKSDGSDGLGTNATFEFPAGIVADTNGNIFVADADDYAIRELTPVGTNYYTSTILGRERVSGTADGTNDSARFYEPYGIALNGAGDLIIADEQNAEIRGATASGTNWASTTLAGFGDNTGSADGTNTMARFNQPFGIAVDGTGILFVADDLNSTIRKITPSGTNWVTTTIGGQVGENSFQDGVGTNAWFYGPSAVAVDKNGTVYVADSVNAAIRAMVPQAGNYNVTTIAGGVSEGSVDGTNTDAKFDYPSGIAVDTSSNLYVADCNNSTIRKIKLSGTNWVTTTIAGSAGVTSYAEGTGTNALFNSPRGVAVDKNGVVYVTDWVNNLIRTLTPNGNVYVSAPIAGQFQYYGDSDGTNSSATFAYPTHIAVDGNGILYVTDANNNTIRKLVHSGTNWIVTTLGGVPRQSGSSDGRGAAALFNDPQGIAVDANGTVYVTEEFNSTVVQGLVLPVILMGDPAVSAGQLQLPFQVEQGSPTTFSLWQAAQPGVGWTVNGGATLSVATPGVAYKFIVAKPVTNAFYQVETP